MLHVVPSKRSEVRPRWGNFRWQERTSERISNFANSTFRDVRRLLSRWKNLLQEKPPILFPPPTMTTPTFLSLPKMPQKCTSERGAKRGSRREHMAGSVPSSCAYSSTSMSSLRGANSGGGGTLGGSNFGVEDTRPVSFPLINYEWTLSGIGTC